MSYLSNEHNVVKDATVIVSAIIPSNVIEQTDDNQREGRGRVTVTGDFEGQEDTTVEIEVVDDAVSGSPRISRPVFSGVGNGQMTNVSADAALDPQDIVVVLESLGTDTIPAKAQFEGVPISAKATGSSGNGILIRVLRDQIVTTLLDYALQEDLQVGKNEYYGEQWNFGAALMTGDGNIPSTAPRLRFGDDPQVYRQFRKWNGNGYVYGFSPPPVRGVVKGSTVKLVTGTYTITITQGATVETLEDVITRYDALYAIRSESTLVNVDGAILEDYKISGSGTTELSEQTQSYISGITKSGTQAIQQADLGLTVAEIAPTETLVIQCRDVTTPGQEIWGVVGEVTGIQTSAKTGEAYAEGPYEFTIPIPEDAIQESDASISVFYHPAPRGDVVSIPKLCVENKLLGALASDGKWFFEWKKKPPPPCDCSTETIEGGPDEECLGIDVEVLPVGNEARLRRVQRMTTYVRELVGSNTAPVNKVAAVDVEWIKKSANIFLACLKKLAGGAIEQPLWQINKAYKVDEVREPTVRNGYRYAVTIAGTSHATTEPTWPTTIGDTVTDNTVTWECIGKTPFLMWDEAFETWKLEAELLRGFGNPIDAEVWQASHAYGEGNIYVHPTTRNGFIYLAIFSTGNVTGASEPTWPTTLYDNVTDQDVSWTAYRNYWNATASYAEDVLIDPGTGQYFKATTGGTSGATEPTWTTDGTPVTDGSVEWTPVSGADMTTDNSQLGPLREAFFVRYDTICNDLLAAAGIEENFKSANIDGDGCWQDFDDSEYWWEYMGEERYLPLQNNHWQVLSILRQDADGNDYAESTKIWGFGLKFGCPDGLIEGDQLEVVVVGSAGVTGVYQEGDTVTATINRATPVELQGGQTGDDTLTWSVNGTDFGAFPDYELVKSSPTPYSEDGLGFEISLGGIDFGLGDSFRFTLEGGRFKYKIGSDPWSSPMAIQDSVALSDGLVANFEAGAAPNWVAGDAWEFLAEAINGPDGLKSPTNRRTAWSGATEILIGLGSGLSVEGLFIGDHLIPSTAEILFQGSNNNFATTPLSEVIPWSKRNIYFPFTGNYLAYRLAIDEGGSIQWLWMGQPLKMLMDNGVEDRGVLTKNWQFSSVTRRKAMGVEIEHAFLTQASVTAMLTALEYSCINDGRRIGIVPHSSGEDASIMVFQENSLPVKEVFDYQPDDSTHRVMSFTLKLEPVA